MSAFFLAASGHAADWPSFGGTDPGRNMLSQEKNLPDTFKPGEESTMGCGMLPGRTENVRWVVQFWHCINRNPTVADGRGFVGTDDASLQNDPRLQRTKGGMIWCLDEKTGATLWKLPVPVRSKERFPAQASYLHQNISVSPSPTVVGNRVYVVSSAADILCLDVKGSADGNDGPFTDEASYIAGDKNPPVALEKFASHASARTSPRAEPEVGEQVEDFVPRELVQQSLGHR